mgnify:CR=1 FL=1
MEKVISIGKQNFASLRENHYFFVDKSHFIKDWWENGDEITLITLSLIHISEPTRPY